MGVKNLKVSYNVIFIYIIRQFWENKTTDKTKINVYFFHLNSTILWCNSINTY